MSKDRPKRARPEARDDHPADLPQQAPAPAPAAPESASPVEQPGDLTPPPVIDDRDFEVATGESLDHTLNLDNWQSGLYLCGDWERIEREVGEALEQRRRTATPFRKRFFPLIASRPNAPKGAGVFQATTDQLKRTQANVLFNGGV